MFRDPTVSARVRDVVIPRSREALSRSRDLVAHHLGPAWHDAVVFVQRQAPARWRRRQRTGLRAALGRVASREVGMPLLAAAVAAAAAVAVTLWVTRPARRAPVRPGGRFDIVRCPLHGIAYDAELEECTECAKAAQGTLETSLR